MHEYWRSHRPAIPRVVGAGLQVSVCVRVCAILFGCVQNSFGLEIQASNYIHTYKPTYFDKRRLSQVSLKRLETNNDCPTNSPLRVVKKIIQNSEKSEKNL